MNRGLSGVWLSGLLVTLAATMITCDPGVYLEDCPGGYLVDGFCRLKDCPTRECPEGFICDNDLCIEVECLGVECGLDEACAHGSCYPRGCQTRNCPGVGEVCIEDECHSASCVCTVDGDCPAGATCVDSLCECPAGQACAAGACYPTDCPTKTCPGYGEVCIDDECVERSCVGVQCNPGESCAGGFCYPNVCTDVGCFGEGEVCINGVCQRRACVDVECEPGFICANGWCYPEDCAGVQCSDFGEVCYQDECIQVDCVGIQCPAGERCARGECFPETCGGEVCESHEVCYNDQCIRTNCVGVICPPGEKCADGECIAKDCGQTGCGDGEVCVDGQCVADDCAHVVCPPGEVCGADLQCYPEDCGGTQCNEYEMCVGGVCVDRMCVDVTCPAGEICVAGNCYDPNDPGCSPACAADEVCENNVCVPVDCAGGRCCPPVECTNNNQCLAYDCDGVLFTCQYDYGTDTPGWSDQGNICTDNDPCTINDACTGGTCVGEDMVCDAGEWCVGGVCRCNGTGPDCVGNETCCTNIAECHDLDIDIDHCGACETPCRRTNATPQCVGGVCSIGQCDALWGDCDGNDANGCETSLETLTDCGGCGVPCDYPGTEMTCTGGVCQIANCDPGFGDCDGIVTNGCENTLDSLTDCGACGVTCDRDHATPSCSGDVCHIETCDPLWDDCNSTDPDGCETSLETITDCNACATPCARANATAECPGGTCRILACNQYWDDCNSTDADGCETSLETLTDCGACGVPCDYPGAQLMCPQGICQIANCDPGFGDCDGLVTNGCENTLDSLQDCGTCGTPCSRANATASCAGDVCHIASCDAGWGDCDGNDANGCEDSLDGLVNCGTCGTPCSRANATPTCAGDVCLIQSCDALYDDCNGVDADGCEISLETLTDCGACGVICDYPGAEMSCAGGICQIANCDPGWGDCDGVVTNGCENTLDSLQDCGACGVTCDRDHATPSCAGDTCHIQSCDSLWDNCNGNDPDGCETSLETLTDCGACNTPCGLPHATATCTGGSCQIGSCDTLWDDCNGNDADGCETSLETLTDCGSCGNPCSRAHATADCSGGSCHIGSCDSLWGDCDGQDSNGCEQTLTTLGNCGSCGTTCSLAHAGETCATGQCRITSCDSLWDNCDGNHSNGCETDLTTLSDCGGCGNTCSLAHATETCATGQCRIASCDSLWGNCDGTHSNGCETSLETLTDCGSCGTPCSRAHATATCSGGSCSIASCDSGWGNCDGNDANGCETDLTTLSDCGGCGVTCSLANASETCATGSCRIASCNSGWGNCDGTHSNGCENSLDSLSDCGSCGTTCSRAHATASCSGDVCHIQSCDSLWDNCDGNDPNGCETSLETLTDCGSCGTPCSAAGATTSCAGGTCHITSCDPGLGDCDGNVGNGCETSLTTLSDCGGCGVTCSLPNASETCATGQCRISSCNSGWGNCDGTHSNGCENSLDSLTNCGACGVTCSRAHATASCAGDFCHIASCDPNWGDCDGNDPNGCETDLANTDNHCGACGNNCGQNAYCQSSNCNCNSLWGNCDGNWGNGCEQTLTTLTHCGACSNPCSLAHANESCATGSCQVTSCDSLWGNCNGNHSDGCETPLDTLSDCGGCSITCNLPNASENCSGGNCQITSCNSNYYDVNGNDADGCECGDTSDHSDSCPGTSAGPTSTQNGIIVRGGGRNDVDCFTVTHTVANPPVGGGNFSISLSGSGVVFDISGSDSCSGDTSYQTSCVSNGSTCETGNNGTYCVCVRSSGSDICSSYSLTFSQ